MVKRLIALVFILAVAAFAHEHEGKNNVPEIDAHSAASVLALIGSAGLIVSSRKK